MKRLICLLLALCLLPAVQFPPAAAAAPGFFTDIADAETKQAAELLYQLNIVNGTGGTNYSPDGQFKRGELAAIGVRLKGIFDVTTYGGTVRFPDVRASHWSHKWVMAAVDTKIMQGRADGLFHPDDPMLYGELITVLMRLLGYTDSDVGLNWPQSYISKAEALGISKGMKFAASDMLTRGQAARLIYNFLFIEGPNGTTYIENEVGAVYLSTALIFESSGSTSLIRADGADCIYDGVLPDSLWGTYATLLIKDNAVLSLSPDETVTYRAVTVKEAQTSRLSLTDETSVSVSAASAVYDWNGDYGVYSSAQATFIDSEPVKLAFKSNGTLLYILRDSWERKIGARYLPEDMLRLRTSGGKTYALDSNGGEYLVTGTISSSMYGHMGRLMVDREDNAVSFTESSAYTYQTVTAAAEARFNGIPTEDGGFAPVPSATEVWTGGETQPFGDIYPDIRPGESFLIVCKGSDKPVYLVAMSARAAGTDFLLAILENAPVEDTITALFGKKAANASIYKNGAKAEADMLEQWDVLQYYESSNVIEASSLRVTAYYKSPLPNPSAPTQISVLGKTFALLPNATERIADLSSGQRLVFLLCADGETIADVRNSGEVSTSTLSLITDNEVIVGKALAFAVGATGPGASQIGKLSYVRGQSNHTSVFSTPVTLQTPAADLDLTGGTLGGVPLAPWCVFYEQVGTSGRATLISSSDIPVRRVSSANILFAETSPSGYITAVLLNDVTGEAYTYGIADDYEQEEYLMGGSYTFTVMAVWDGNQTGGSKNYLTELMANQITPPKKGTIVGIAAGSALNGAANVSAVVTCKKYTGFTRFDFNGTASVTVNGTDIPLGVDSVYIPALGATLDIANARAYCKTFEVYTDPWDYKIRFIIGYP